MRSFALDEYGDLIMPLRWVTDLDAVIQKVLAHLYRVFDEDVYELETGTDWFNVMMSTSITDEQKMVEIRSVISEVEEVTDIVRINYTAPDGDEKRMVLKFQLNTIYGETEEIG